MVPNAGICKNLIIRFARKVCILNVAVTVIQNFVTKCDIGPGSFTDYNLTKTVSCLPKGDSRAIRSRMIREVMFVVRIKNLIRECAARWSSVKHCLVLHVRLMKQINYRIV